MGLRLMSYTKLNKSAFVGTEAADHPGDQYWSYAFCSRSISTRTDVILQKDTTKVKCSEPRRLASRNNSVLFCTTKNHKQIFISSNLSGLKSARKYFDNSTLLTRNRLTQNGTETEVLLTKMFKHRQWKMWIVWMYLHPFSFRIYPSSHFCACIVACKTSKLLWRASNTSNSTLVGSFTHSFILSFIH